MPEHQQTQKSTESKTTSQKQATPRIQAPISNPMAIIQRARINPKSLTPADVLQLQRTIGNRAVGRLLSEIRSSSTTQKAPVQRQEIPEEEEPLQGKFESRSEKETCSSCMQKQEIPEEEEPLQGKMIETIQRQEIPEEEEPLQGKFESIQWQEIPEKEEPFQTKRENNTGMPDNLKAGVENLSGIDMSDVRVHYNSNKPAEVGALAYTQGTNIHVAPGQERHLPHEAWHVVQQAQGKVRPTMQLKGVAVNDDILLEKEADVNVRSIIAKETGRNTKLEKLNLKNQIHVMQGYFTYRNNRLNEEQLNIVFDVLNDITLFGFPSDEVDNLLQDFDKQSSGPLPEDIIKYLSSNKFLQCVNKGTSTIEIIIKLLDESNILTPEVGLRSIFSELRNDGEKEVACFYIENRLPKQNGFRSNNYTPSQGTHAEESMCRDIIDPYIEIEKQYASSSIMNRSFIKIYIYSTYSPCYDYNAPGSKQKHNCSELLSGLISHLPRAILFLGFKHIWEGTKESKEDKEKIKEDSEIGIRILEGDGFRIIEVS